MKKYISKMTPEELFRQLVYCYVNARKPAFYHPKIARGRSHTVSSKLEDLFAYFLSLNLTEDYQFLVDQPLNYGRKQLYPDISLIQESVVRHMFDVKTDLGWKRNEFPQFCKDQQEKLAQFVGQQLSATDGVRKKKFKIRAFNPLNYHIVIISGQNISRSSLDDNLSQVSSLPNVHVYVLFPEQHPNHYGDDIEDFIERVKVNTDDFDRIENFLTN